MAQHPYESIIANISNAAFVQCGGNIRCRRMEIVETPTVAAGVQQAYTPQGLQYQIWDNALNAGAGGWGTTKQALPGATISSNEPIPVGQARGPCIGQPAQTDPAGRTIAAVYPMQVMSATATNTQVLVREFA